MPTEVMVQLPLPEPNGRENNVTVDTRTKYVPCLHQQKLSNNKILAHNNNEITINVETYQRIVNMAHILYQIPVNVHHGSLIDSSANDGISGSDVHAIGQTIHNTNIFGINNHVVSDIPLQLLQLSLALQWDKYWKR